MSPDGERSSVGVTNSCEMNGTVGELARASLPFGLPLIIPISRVAWFAVAFRSLLPIPPVSCPTVRLLLTLLLNVAGGTAEAEEDDVASRGSETDGVGKPLLSPLLLPLARLQPLVRRPVVAVIPSPSNGGGVTAGGGGGHKDCEGGGSPMR